MEDKDKIISLLNGLIETCKDGEKGYWEASDSIGSGFYRVLFRDYARQRTAFAAELQSVVRTLGGNPDRTGTIAGNLHRGWMNLRSALDSRNDRAIALECQRGELAALRNYRHALKLNIIPEQIKSILEKQCAVVRSTRQRIRTMTQGPVAAH